MRRDELAIRRALLYAPLPPKPERRDHRVYWTRQRAIAALRTLEEVPSLGRWIPTPKGMPSAQTLKRLFGSWNAALKAAGWEPPHPGHGTGRPEAETAELQRRVDNGETLTELAAELGVRSQPLGRRLARYRAKHPEASHRVPGTGDRRAA